MVKVKPSIRIENKGTYSAVYFGNKYLGLVTIVDGRTAALIYGHSYLQPFCGGGEFQNRNEAIAFILDWWSVR